MKGSVISTEAQRSRETPAFLMLAMVATAFVLRMLIVALVVRDLPDPTRDFEQFGWEMGWVARSIATGHGFASPFFPITGPTALVPPGYPYLLAAIFRLFGVYSLLSGIAILTLNSLFSALTCVPLYLSTVSLIDKRVALIAGWAWAIHPFAIYFSAARVWDYALTGLLLTTCFWAARHVYATKKKLPWLFLGLLAGLTALSNPSTLSVLFLFLLFVVGHPRSGLIQSLSCCLFATFGLVLVLAPWTIRNYQVLHVVAPVRDNFWLEFRAGNNGNDYESNDRTARPPSSPIELSRFEALGETAYIARARNLSVAYLKDHPVHFLASTLHRIVCYWTGYWSFSSAYLANEPVEVPEVLFSLALLWLSMLGGYRLWRSNRPAMLAYLILIVAFPATYYITHVKADFRHAIEPELTVLTTLGALALKRRRTNTDDASKTVQAE